MISINFKQLDVVQLHGKLVQELFEKRSLRKQLQRINYWIRSNLGTEYSLQRLLVATPKELEELVQNFRRSGRSCNSDSLNIIKKIYSGFSTGTHYKMKLDSERNYNAYELINLLGIKVCPYCNRNFIQNLEKSRRRVAQMDHFYSSSEFPFLAMSFFNLIPSCTTCNFLKRDSKLKLHNPYSEDSCDHLLRIGISALAPGYPIKSRSVTVKWEAYSEQMANNMKIFQLEEIYAQHEFTVRNIVEIAYLESSGYIEDLRQRYLTRIGMHNVDVRNLFNLYGFEEQEDLEKPLSKFTRDIWASARLHIRQ